MNTNPNKSTQPIIDFEKPISELENKIEDMRRFTSSENFEFKEEIIKLEKKLSKLKKEVYSSITPWDKVQIAKHPNRPHSMDYIDYMVDDWVELHGDRNFADDKSIVSGMGKIDDQPVFIVAQQKGRDVKENIVRNFGMPNPEGYRKALRIFKMAEKFNRPIITLIDTPGAFPGIGAEERGQGEAIARNLREMAVLNVPVIVSIIGEGASGGALGIGVGDRILMFEHSWYCVISPEGCAAILWGDRSKAKEMAQIMHLTSDDLKKMGLIDKIVKEPLGGAHKDTEKMKEIFKQTLVEELKDIIKIPKDDLINKRIEKYNHMGEIKE